MKMHDAKLYILALMLLISFSCSFEEREVPGPSIDEDEFVDAVIHISSSSSPSTYALTQDGEEWIKEVDVLAFKVSDSGSDSGEEYYDYRTRTTDVKVGNQQQEFTVSVKRSKNNEKYRFAIIANASAAVNNANFTTRATKEQVYARIISDLSGSDRWDATEMNPDEPNKPIPMWGEASEVKEVTGNMVLPAILMLRALSRIDVVVLPAAQNDFRLTDIFVYNTNRKGRVIPDKANLQSDGNVNGASIPADNNLTKGPIQYTSSSTVEYKREIYLYEADAVKENEALQATCLVIGGYYDNNVPTSATKKSYYRVDFFVDKKNNNLSFKPILRNHCYIINIANVLNEGYETPEEAFDKREINMTVDIESWVIGESPYDGTPYNFVINRNSFENIGAGAFSGSFVLTTEDPTGWTSSASDGVTLTPKSGLKEITDQTVGFEVASTAQEPIIIDIKSGPITKRITITR
ncbi:MAG: hypothetical protein LBL58_13135 [Tannerellaceae bacterium]|jgi:hypothetical protein|nr:hypothetical protein [Tannerellaceae bacterium]